MLNTLVQDMIPLVPRATLEAMYLHRDERSKYNHQPPTISSGEVNAPPSAQPAPAQPAPAPAQPAPVPAQPAPALAHPAPAPALPGPSEHPDLHLQSGGYDYEYDSMGHDHEGIGHSSEHGAAERIDNIKAQLFAQKFSWLTNGGEVPANM